MLLAAIRDCLGIDWVRRPTDCPNRCPEHPATCLPGPDQPDGSTGDGREAPPNSEVETIAELVRAEDWRSAADWCDDLAAGQPELAPFAGRVRALVAARDRKALLDWFAGLH